MKLKIILDSSHKSSDWRKMVGYTKLTKKKVVGYTKILMTVISTNKKQVNAGKEMRETDVCMCMYGNRLGILPPSSGISEVHKVRLSLNSCMIKVLSL